MRVGVFSPSMFLLGCAVTMASMLGARSTIRRLRTDPDVQFESKFIGLTAAIILATLTGVGLLAAAFLDFVS